MKALAAGKHVLNEKPSADTAEETQRMFEYAEAKGLVLLDAYHYRYGYFFRYTNRLPLPFPCRFHPALKRAKAIIDSGELGVVKNLDVKMILTKGIFGDGDIRYDYALGGGALMDLGCGCFMRFSALRFD
jgi:predicted dehydrogenase